LSKRWHLHHGCVGQQRLHLHLWLHWFILCQYRVLSRFWLPKRWYMHQQQWSVQVINYVVDRRNFKNSNIDNMQLSMPGELQWSILQPWRRGLCKQPVFERRSLFGPGSIQWSLPLQLRRWLHRNLVRYAGERVCQSAVSKRRHVCLSGIGVGIFRYSLFDVWKLVDTAFNANARQATPVRHARSCRISVAANHVKMEPRARPPVLVSCAPARRASVVRFATVLRMPVLRHRV